MSIPIQSSTTMLSSLKRLREHTQSMNRIPGAQPVANAITHALDALEDIVTGRDTTGSQRLREALVGIMMQLSTQLPTWWQDMSDRDKKQLGMPTQDDRVPKDRTDMVSIVNRILRPNEAMPAATSSTASGASSKPFRPLTPMPPTETQPPSTAGATANEASPSLAPVRQQIGEQAGGVISGAVNGTDIIIRRLKRLLQQYAPGLDQGLSNTQSPNTLITALKRILKSQQALAASSQDARHAELLNRLFDHINDGIEDIGELESLLKGLKSLGNIPPLLMDALKGAVGDWLAQECEGLSPNQSRDLISQVNTLAKQTIGEDLVSSEDPFTHPSDDPTNPTPIAFTPVSVPMAHMATPYHAPQATQAENNVFHESHQDTPLQRAALFIASITQCMTHHALQIAEEAFEPLLKATQKTTRQNPNEEQKN